MRLLESIILHIFPGLKDRIEDCERKASNACIIATVALSRTSDCEECVEVEDWTGTKGGKDVGNN